MSWLGIILALIALPLGHTMVIEEYILSIQIIFIHIYIFSSYLPSSLRVPLSGLSRIQNLNYFIPEHGTFVERILLGDTVQDSPLRFAQYHHDNNFTRAIYPILLVNVFLLLWFGFIMLLKRIAKKKI